MAPLHNHIPPAELSARLQAARARLLALAATLPEDGWLGPQGEHLNPPLWELGHIVWFQEHWCLRLKPGREPGASPLLAPLEPSLQPWADWLYNSSRIPHEARWQAPLVPREEALAWGGEVLRRTQARLGEAPTPALCYFAGLSLCHELMHIEAWWMMWQARGLAPPFVPALPALGEPRALRPAAGSVELGSRPGDGFVFDNEKWAHAVHLPAFEIDARPVTNAEFLAFVEAGGYGAPRFWSVQGREWLAQSGARHPLHWRRTDGGWELHRFDVWLPLPGAEPALHVNRFEAEAYAAWRERRLPTAAEWLRAARTEGFILGDCWEWTASPFAAYPGFEADPYTDYSLPWFGSHAELRGAGSWVTDAVLRRLTFRNFYLPQRRDPFVGFRTAG